MKQNQMIIVSLLILLFSCISISPVKSAYIINVKEVLIANSIQPFKLPVENNDLSVTIDFESNLSVDILSMDEKNYIIYSQGFKANQTVNFVLFSDMSALNTKEFNKEWFFPRIGNYYICIENSNYTRGAPEHPSVSINLLVTETTGLVSGFDIPTFIFAFVLFSILLRYKQIKLKGIKPF